MCTKILCIIQYLLKSIPFYILLFIIESCSITNGQEDFEKFSAHFTIIHFPTIVSDSSEFLGWPQEKLIDTTYVLSYGLIRQFVNSEYPFSTIKDYKCSYWGKYEMDSLVVLIYKTFTTEAGRGNPELVMTTFSKGGVRKDVKTVLWNEPYDPLFSNQIKLSIINAGNFEITSLKRINGFLNGKIVPKSIDQKVIDYSVLEDGTIILRGENNKQLFFDKNPAILDDIPAK